jgi:equilibrative nucleoside transporter 1/2/3
MITATPYFLSRLSDTLRPPFSSYISITFTVANFVFLAQATATSKQARGVSLSRALLR